MRIGRPMGPMQIAANTYRKYTHSDATKLPDYIKNTAVDVTISAQARALQKSAEPNGAALKPRLPNVGEE